MELKARWRNEFHVLNLNILNHKMGIKPYPIHESSNFIILTGLMFYQLTEPCKFNNTSSKLMLVLPHLKSRPDFFGDNKPASSLCTFLVTLDLIFRYL
jgi:hypothetical protein